MSDHIKEAPHNAHYKGHAIEPLDYIEEHFGTGFHFGSIFKYLTRYQKTHNYTDLVKARDYLTRIMELEIERDA